MDIESIESKGTKIIIGQGCLSQLKASIPLDTSKIFILVDENTAKHCLPLFLKHYDLPRDYHILTIKSGEEHKELITCTYLWNQLIEGGTDRKSLLINLGGGVIGDLGGFVASAFKRGINFINIPTTLLSQVDAAVGGKVGIDFHGLKNELGFFSNPKAVFIEPDFLKTLPPRQILSGFAEIVKHALIFDKSYWKEIRSFDLNSFEFSGLISKSIAIKNSVVSQDPKENGLRKILNFGHTIGHAVESYSLKNDKDPLLHGEAVAIGIICESYLSFKKGLLKKEELSEITEFILSKFGKKDLGKEIFKFLISLMENDKKNEKGLIKFSLLNSIGSCSFNIDCDKEFIEESLEYYINGK